jgi:hypothetical protein
MLQVISGGLSLQPDAGGLFWDASLGSEAGGGYWSRLGHDAVQPEPFSQVFQGGAQSGAKAASLVYYGLQTCFRTGGRAKRVISPFQDFLVYLIYAQGCHFRFSFSNLAFSFFLIRFDDSG